MTTVFYSWQSDLPDETNRSLIATALDHSLQTLRGSDVLLLEPVMDRDTQGVPGAPDIAQVIFSKIDIASAFVADASIVTPSDAPRPIPNPNVLVELGYALKSLRFSKVILVMNLEYGGPSMLPFDLRMRRIIPYRCSREDNDKGKIISRLRSRLASGLAEILAYEQPSDMSLIDPETRDLNQMRAEIMQLKRIMPAFLAALKQCLVSDSTELKREFAVLPNRRVSYGGPRPPFHFFEEDFQNLRDKVRLLQEYRLVTDVSRRNVPTYRIVDQFRLLLLDLDLEE